MSYGTILRSWIHVDAATDAMVSDVSGKIINRGEPYWYHATFGIQCKESELADARQWILTIPLADVSNVPQNIQVIDCTNTTLVYTGTWTLVENDFDANNGTVKYSSTLNDKVTLAFNGIGVRIRFKRDTSCGNAVITLGTVTRTVTTYNDTSDFRFFTIYAEAVGSLTLEIKVGESGKAVKIDAITILRYGYALDTKSDIQEIVSTKTEINKILGFTSADGYVPTFEQYPATGIYYGTPTPIADGVATVLLMDAYRRAIISSPAAYGKTTLILSGSAINTSTNIKTVTTGTVFYLAGGSLTVTTLAANVTGSCFLEVDTAGDSSFRVLAPFDLWSAAAALTGPCGSVPVSLSCAVPISAGSIFRVRSTAANLKAIGTIIGWED